MKNLSEVYLLTSPDFVTHHCRTFLVGIHSNMYQMLLKDTKMDYRKWMRSIHNFTSVGRCYKGLRVSRNLNQLEEHTSMPSKDSDDVLLDPNYTLQYSNHSLTGVTAAPHAVSSHQICFIEDQDDERGIG